MRGSFEGLLERYGQDVSLHYDGGDVGVPARAFVQGVAQRREDWWQEMPTPLGRVRRDRFLYLGEPGVPLEGMERGYVRWQGKRLRVQAAQAVYAGKRVSHWWAVLRLMDEE